MKILVGVLLAFITGYIFAQILFEQDVNREKLPCCSQTNSQCEYYEAL